MDLRKPDVTLENVSYYYQEDIEAAELHHGVVCHKDSSKEEITDIMIAGHDETFIRKQGINCDFKWMLKDQKIEFLNEMDNIIDKPLHRDYRSLAQVLNISNSKVHLSKMRYRDHQESVTEQLLKHWSEHTGKRITFQMILTMLRHPGLVGNKTAAECVEKTLAKCGHKVRFFNSSN